MGAKSKRKGAEFERKVSKALSLWLTDGERDDVLWRSAMSGGRATIGLRKDTVRGAQAGDLSAIHPLAFAFIERFYVECKNYQNLDFGSLLFCRGTLFRFWVGTVRAARAVGKKPLLIAKQSRIDPYVLLEESDLLALLRDQSDLPCMLSFCLPTGSVTHFGIVTTLPEFLRCCAAERLYE